MATKPRTLKVYQAQFGFHDSVVAAPNQAAALEAWGVRQNLFAEGQAKLSDDAEATKAALLHPQTPLRRTVGSGDRFELEPRSLPKVPKGRRKPPAAKKPATKDPPKPPVDRGPLTAAEATVQSLDETRRREEASLRRRQEDLDAEAAKAQAAYVCARRDAEAVLSDARRRFLDAGGEPKSLDSSGRR